jgi:hypothetical protein
LAISPNNPNAKNVVDEYTQLQTEIEEVEGKLKKLNFLRVNI